MFKNVFDRFKTQDICERAVQENIIALIFVSDKCNNQENCERAVLKES